MIAKSRWGLRGPHESVEAPPTFGGFGNVTQPNPDRVVWLKRLDLAVGY